MRKALYVLVVAIGLLQITGYLLKNKTIKGLGAATASSPLPIVFTQVKEVETFASDFYLQYVDENSAQKEVRITPEIYSRLKGPYNRRNIFGAAISYGPVLPEQLWKSVLAYAICNKVLLTEIGLPATAKNVTVRIKTKTKGRNNEWILNPDCAE